MLDAIFAIPGMMLILARAGRATAAALRAQLLYAGADCLFRLDGLANCTGRAYDGQSGRY